MGKLGTASDPTGRSGQQTTRNPRAYEEAMADMLGVSIQANISRLTAMLAEAMDQNGRMLDILDQSRGRHKGKTVMEGPAMNRLRQGMGSELIGQAMACDAARIDEGPKQKQGCSQRQT